MRRNTMRAVSLTLMLALTSSISAGAELIPLQPPSGSFRVTSISSEGGRLSGVAILDEGQFPARWTPADQQVIIGGSPFRKNQAIWVSEDAEVIVAQRENDAGHHIGVLRWSTEDGINAVSNSGLEAFLPGALESFIVSPRGVSGDGSTFIGAASGNGESRTTAVKWQDRRWASLGDGTAYDLSRDGEIVVGGSFPSTGERHLVAGYWQDDRFTELVDSATPSIAERVSPDGRYIAGHDRDGVIVWDRMTGEPTRVTLPDIAIDESTHLISGDGNTIVGRYYHTRTDEGFPFIWREAIGSQTFDEFYDSLELDLSEWRELGSITALSHDATRIAGFGTRADGSQHAWLLVVPEPSANLSLTIIVCGLLLRAKTVQRVAS